MAYLHIQQKIGTVVVDTMCTASHCGCSRSPTSRKLYLFRPGCVLMGSVVMSICRCSLVLIV